MKHFFWLNKKKIVYLFLLRILLFVFNYIIVFVFFIWDVMFIFWDIIGRFIGMSIYISGRSIIFIKNTIMTSLFKQMLNEMYYQH